MKKVISDNFSTQPYWIENVPPLIGTLKVPPKYADVIIIGGGYAGLSTAFTMAKANRTVIVFEACRIGDGASSRSAGSLGNLPKAKLAQLTERYGSDIAREVYLEARLAREYVERLIVDEKIDCDLQTRGRVVAAHSTRAFRKLQNSLSTFEETMGEVQLYSAEDQGREIGSNSFHGVLVVNSSATLQPALFHRGLANSALKAGAFLAEKSRVTDIRRTNAAFEVIAGEQSFIAKDVVIATNAETGRETSIMRKLRRRLTIVPAFALVTDEMMPETINSVLPNLRSFSDTLQILHYMAPAGEKRLVMSGRAGRSDYDLQTKAERLFDYFKMRFPALETTRVSHCWSGYFALTDDWIPHIGLEEGVHYILGCCGVGVPMSTYLGHRIGMKILGEEVEASAYDRPLPRIPYWPANNFFLPAAVRALALRDRLFR